MSRALLAALLLATGCSATRFQRAEGFDPRVPLRVAVLPFVDRAGGDLLVARPFTAVLDLVPVLSDDRLTREHAPALLREKLQGNLHRTELDVVDLHVVDSVLAHRRLDPVAAHDGDRAAAARALGEALGADAVAFGWVTAWDRDYYVVESVVTAGLRVELRDAVTGGLLYEAEAEQRESSGVSKLPIAYSPDGAAQAVLAQSLKGLRNTLFVSLSDDLARAIVEGLAPPASVRAAARAPELSCVAHSAGGPLAPGDELTVAALGSPGCRATFRVGHGPPVPMTESTPGRYRGSLRVSSAHAWRGERLTVRVVNEALLGASMTVGRPPLSTR